MGDGFESTVSGLSGLKLRYDDERASALEACARGVREALLSVCAEDVSSSAVSLLAERVCVPRPAKIEAVRLDSSVSLRPSSVKVVGSWLSRSCLASLCSLDLECVLPSSLVTANDILNGRYWEKRASYSVALGCALQRNGFVVAWSELDNDARKPILVVRPAEDARSVVRVLPAADPRDLVGAKIAKLSPSSNCVRTVVATVPVPTPRYNDALLRECGSYSRHVKMVHAAVAARPAVADTIVLAKAWLAHERRRFDGVSGFVASMLIVAMIRKETFPSSCQSHELFLAFVRGLCDWTGPLNLPLLGEEAQDLFGSVSNDEADWGLAAFAAQHEVVFLDRAARVNLAARISKAALHEVKERARATLAAVERCGLAAVLAGFCVRRRPAWAAYDAVVRIPVQASLHEGAQSSAPQGIESPETSSRAGAWRSALPGLTAEEGTNPTVLSGILGEPLMEAVGRRAAAVVERALSDRASSVRCVPLDRALCVPSREYSMLEPGVALVPDFLMAHVAIGVRLVPDARAATPILRGPSVHEPAALKESFRTFWGPDKAELRRFRDGTVIESVVWKPPDNKAVLWRERVPERAVRHCLARHEPRRCSQAARKARADRLNARGTCDEAKACPAGLARLMYVGNEALAALIGPDDASEALAALERLGSALRRLDEKSGKIPLRVVTVSACCARSRGTAVLAVARDGKLGASDLGADETSQGPRPIGRPIEAVITLEHSAKWPRAHRSFQAARLAVLVRLARVLPKLSLDHLRFVGVCGSGRPLLEAPRLRVIYEGFIFMLRLAPPKHLMLKAEVGIYQGTKVRTVDDDERVCRTALAHHAFVRALGAQNRCFAAATRLVARWLDAQLLSDQVPHSFVELLLAAVFAPQSTNAADCAAEGLEPPGSALRGFLLALRLLCVFDWKHDVLYVHCAVASSNEDEVEARFIADRAALARADRLGNLALKRDAMVIAADFSLEANAASALTPNTSPLAIKLISESPPEAPVLGLVCAAARETLQTVASTLFVERSLTELPPPTAWLDLTFGRRGGAASRRAFHASLRIDGAYVARGAMDVPERTDDVQRIMMSPRALLAKDYFANLGDGNSKRRRTSKFEHPRVLVDSEPVTAFVHRLRAQLGDWALFFFDQIEPGTVGVIFRPRRFHARPYAAMESAYTLPSPNKTDAILPNLLELLQQAKHLSGGLVQTTELHD